MSNLSSGRLLCFQHLLFRTFSSASTTKTVPAQTKVFDRETKRRQRNWAASQPDFDLCRFMRDEFGYRIADKVFDLLKSHPVCIDLGCGAGHIGQHLVGENVRSMVQCDMSDALVRRSKAAAENEFPTLRLIGDEEAVPFRQECADLILSGCSAHWINDLPGWFGRCYQTLRPDGVLIGGILAGESLHQIRISLQLAEMERLGGLGAHISPFVEPQDIAVLMNRAGFQMVTIDMDEILINYPNIFVLMHDLQLMAESNASLSRSANLKRETLVAADAIYRAMFSTGGQGDEKLSYPVTFQMVSFIGWRPGPNMPKTARRGSQNVSFKDVGKFIERAGEMGIKVEDEERPKKKL